MLRERRLEAFGRVGYPSASIGRPTRPSLPMLGLVLSVIVSAAPALAASASVTCPDDPASCDAATVGPFAPAAGLARGDGDDQPREYATPAEIDCPAPALLRDLMSECDGTPLDAWYRASRYPDSERSTGTLSSGARGRGERRQASGPASCRGVPRDDGGGLTVSAPQPLALVALPALPPSARDPRPPLADFVLPSRSLEPPERPPARVCA